MRTSLIVTVAIIIFSIKLHSQLLFQENFNKPFNPVANGWSVQNLSAVANPTFSWFQGNASSFPSYNGGPDDWYGCNFFATNAGVPVTLSAWLITPTLTIVDGSVLEFTTRTWGNPASYPDRLEVYLSTAGSGTNVGSSFTSVGTFSTLLLSINPSLTATGYPGSWTVYSISISGVPNALAGRIGFRYHVPNSGTSPQATNGDIIGLDAVRFTGPCTASVPSYTTCAGQTISLAASGGISGSTYTWAPGGNNSPSISVTPNSTSIYTLNYSAGLFACDALTSTVTISPQLNISVASSKSMTCPGSSVTLTASGPANSYTWVSPAGNGTSVTITPSATSIYTVLGSSGSSMNYCAGSATFQQVVFPQPNIVASASPAPYCTGKNFTLSATGGTVFSWKNSSGTLAAVPKVLITPTVTGMLAYTVTGTDINGCQASAQLSVSVGQTPNLSSSVSQSLICVNESITLSASGADEFQWSGAASSTLSSINFSSAAGGVETFTVIGVNADGCSKQSVLTVTVETCAGEKDVMRSDVSVFPNPFGNEIYIAGTSGTVVIYNMLGESLKTQTFIEAAAINTGDLGKGCYVMKVVDEEGRVILFKKVMKH